MTCNLRPDLYIQTWGWGLAVVSMQNAPTHLTSEGKSIENPPRVAGRGKAQLSATIRTSQPWSS